VGPCVHLGRCSFRGDKRRSGFDLNPKPTQRTESFRCIVDALAQCWRTCWPSTTAVQGSDGLRYTRESMSKSPPDAFSWVPRSDAVRGAVPKARAAPRDIIGAVASARARPALARASSSVATAVGELVPLMRNLKGHEGCDAEIGKRKVKVGKTLAEAAGLASCSDRRRPVAHLHSTKPIASVLPPIGLTLLRLVYFDP